VTFFSEVKAMEGRTDEEALLSRSMSSAGSRSWEDRLPRMEGEVRRAAEAGLDVEIGVDASTVAGSAGIEEASAIGSSTRAASVTEVAGSTGASRAGAGDVSIRAGASDSSSFGVTRAR
jgi:hypothetical protein